MPGSLWVGGLLRLEDNQESEDCHDNQSKLDAEVQWGRCFPNQTKHREDDG